jgi:hypothetical protein
VLGAIPKLLLSNTIESGFAELPVIVRIWHVGCNSGKSAEVQKKRFSARYSNEGLRAFFFRAGLTGRSWQ